VLDGDLVFVAGGGPGQSMMALEQSTGRVEWKTGNELMTHATPVVATLHGVRQVIFHMQSGLVALEAASGRRLWTFPFPYKVSTAASPVVGGQLVFCTAGYEVGGAACEITSANGQFTATEVWRRRGDREVASLWSPPVYRDGPLYGMISYKEYGRGPLKCVDLKTGEVRWREPGFGAGNVVLMGDLLVALTDDGHVTLCRPSPKGFEELARFKAVTGKCWTTPAVADGRLYVRSTREGACFELPR
jgi:outer membrane protein assembly factor BamB